MTGRRGFLGLLLAAPVAVREALRRRAGRGRRFTGTSVKVSVGGIEIKPFSVGDFSYQPVTSIPTEFVELKWNGKVWTALPGGAETTSG